MKATLLLILFFYSCAKEVQTLAQEPISEVAPTIPESLQKAENPDFYNLFFSVQHKYKTVAGDTILISTHGYPVLLLWTQQPYTMTTYTQFYAMDTINNKIDTIGLLTAVNPNNFALNLSVNGFEVIDTVTTSVEKERMCYETFYTILKTNNCPIIGQ